MEIDYAQELYRNGNDAIIEDDYDFAVQFYTKAIELDGSRSEFYKNRARVNLNMQKYLEVKLDAEKSLELNQNQAKVLLWKGIACFNLEEYENAKNSFLEGQKIDEDDVTFIDWLQRCEEKFVQKLAPVKIKHDWYQTEMFVNITILIKNVKQDEIKVESTLNTIFCKIQRENLDDYELNLTLAHEVDPNYCKWKITPSKIEIQLKKTSVRQWMTLHSSATNNNNVKHFTNKPNSHSNTKNWDKIVVDMTKDDIEEQDCNDMFKKLYSEASDETKRAMNKSFVESGGTCLSTDWGNVSKEKYKVKAPDGMEWRKWDT